MNWIGCASALALGTIFLLQAVALLIPNESLNYVAYEVLGQWPEGWCPMWLITIEVLTSSSSFSASVASPSRPRSPRTAGGHGARGARHPPRRAGAGLAGEAGRRRGAVGLGDFVADEATEEPFEAATENLQRADIQRALDALPERERRVIELRYGLRGHEPLTLEEVGSAFGVTRERIRQIENNTLKKLKQLPEAQRLRELA